MKENVELRLFKKTKIPKGYLNKRNLENYLKKESMKIIFKIKSDKMGYGMCPRIKGGHAMRLGIQIVTKSDNGIVGPYSPFNHIYLIHQPSHYEPKSLS